MNPSFPEHCSNLSLTPPLLAVQFSHPGRTPQLVSGIRLSLTGPHSRLRAVPLRPDPFPGTCASRSAAAPCGPMASCYPNRQKQPYLRGASTRASRLQVLWPVNRFYLNIKGECLWAESVLSHSIPTPLPRVASTLLLPSVH